MSTTIDTIRALHVEKGDVLVVTNTDVARALSEIESTGPDDPLNDHAIIVAPDGIEAISREEAIKILRGIIGDEPA